MIRPGHPEYVTRDDFANDLVCGVCGQRKIEYDGDWVCPHDVALGIPPRIPPLPPRVSPVVWRARPQPRD
jgi:hypothetical protein